MLETKLPDHRALLFAVSLLVIARIPAQGQVSPVTPAPPERKALPAQAAPPRQPSESYRLSPRDVILIRVFREDDLTTEARIDKNGTITFPLIGNVRITGQTPQQASQTIEKLLGADYLVDPQVSISVMDYSKRRFTVLGQVGRPGAYEMPDDSTVNLLEAIGMAGGYTRIAQPSRITLKRTVNGEEVVHKLDAKRMAKDGNQETFEVLPGDTITVGESLF